MREGYRSHPVCLLPPSADIRRVCDKIGLPVYSSLHAKGFKLSVFAKKPSISSSSLFSLRTAERAAILKHWSCYVDFNDHYQQLSVHCIYAALWRFEFECQYSNESTSWSWLTGLQLECEYSNQSTSWSWLNRICVGVRVPRVRELVHCECLFNASSFVWSIFAHVQHLANLFFLPCLHLLHVHEYATHTQSHTHTHLQPSLASQTNQIQHKHNLCLCSSLWQIFFVYF